MIRRIAREPLVQFLAAGAAIFLLAGWIGGRRAANRIVVTDGQIDRMIDTFAKTWMRPPSPQELAGLVDSYVKDEIYFREAAALGLDRDDEVIRRRMRLKLEFWNQNAAEATEPTEAELAAFLAAQPEKFRTPSRLSFEQVFLRQGREPEASALLQALRAGRDPESAGDPLPLPSQLDDAALDEVARMFGEDFAIGLERAAPGGWEGPVPSTYGLHLVRVRFRTPSATPPLPEIRDAVAREWFAKRRTEADRVLYDSLRKKYTVTVEPRRGEPTRAPGNAP